MSRTPIDQSQTRPSNNTLSNSQAADWAAKLSEVATGLAAVQAKQEPDDRDRLEAEDASKQQAKYLAELIEDLKTNRELRREYGDKVFKYLRAYSIVCLVIVLLQGWKIKGFELNEATITVLVGSTAVAAIGLVGIVVKGLFGAVSDKGKKKKKKDEE